MSKSIDASRNSIFHNKLVVKVELFVASIHVKKAAIGTKKFCLDYALYDSKMQKINTKNFSPKIQKKSHYGLRYYTIINKVFQIQFKMNYWIRIIIRF